MRLPFLRRGARRGDADYADEVAAHLALEADRLAAEGFPRHDAMLEARRRFGNVGIAKEHFHDRQRLAWWDAVARQARTAARRLRRAPAFSITAALTLTLGIGATTAVFSLVEAVLLRPLPFARPEQLVEISHTLSVQGVTNVDQSDATYLYYRAANHVFTNVGAYQSTAVNLSATGAGDASHARRAQAARASASVFQLLGVAPLHGRAFANAEDVPSAAPVTILSEQLWRRQYGANSAIVGQTVMIDGVAHQVVGIMPQQFAFPDDATELWLPIGIDPAKTASATFDFHAVARLRPGVSTQAASGDLTQLLPRVPDAYPGRLTAPAIAITKMRAVVKPLSDAVVGNVGQTLCVVFGAATFLLLIACANVANLFLVRAEERQHELSVRRALGASRGAVATEFLTEAMIIAVLGGTLGVAGASVGLRALRAGGSSLSIPRLGGVGVDGSVLLVAVAATLLTAIVASLVPAVRFGGSDVANALGQSGRGTTAGRQRHRVRRVFVVAQVALALVLITGAGLMARSFAALRAVSPGFDAKDASTFRIALPAAEYPSISSAFGLVERMLDEVRTLPGVRFAGAITKIPLDSEARQDSGTWVRDRLPMPGKPPSVHQVAFASAHAFSALGVPLIQGREFGQLDPHHPPAEAIVTRALAQRYWGDSVAVGRHVGFSPVGPWYTIVGVTGDIRGSGVDQPPDEAVYLPMVATLSGGAMSGGGPANPTLWTPRNLSIVVRATDGTVLYLHERTVVRRVMTDEERTGWDQTAIHYAELAQRYRAGLRLV